MNDNKYVSWQSLSQYIDSIRHSINQWEIFFSTRTIDWLPASEINDWLQKIRGSYDVLEALYLYDEMKSVSFIPQSSGFVCVKHLIEMYMLKNQGIDEEDDSLEGLKRVFLDNLFSTKKINYNLLEKIAKADAKNMIREKSILVPFELTFFKNLEGKSGRRAYLCSWNTFVLQSLPVKYVMLFEATDPWYPNEANLNSLGELLREESTIVASMVDFAKIIDRASASIHPKWIGRIILGPVQISNFTEDEHHLQQILDSIGSPDDFISTSRIIYEYIVAEGEQSIKSLLDPSGELHKYMQNYVARHDGEHSKRGVTHLEKHLFAPHQVIQVLDRQYIGEIDHQITIYRR